MRARLEFILPVEPVTCTHQAKKIVRCGGFYKLADTVELINGRGIYCALLAGHRPERPLSGAVTLVVDFIFPQLKGTAKRDLNQDVPKVTKPDCDNLAKTFIDCMTRMGFWRNDAQVSCLTVRKFRGPKPCIKVKVEWDED